MAELLRTDRLVVREWELDDAPAAVGVYGRTEVARWLTPAMDRVDDDAAMARQLQTWIEETRAGESGLGHWAVLTADGTLVGGVGLHLLPVDEQDVEIGWQLGPEHWGRGYAVEAGAAVIERAFGLDVDEVFALVRPGNARGARTARSVGMSWVGETDKYYGLRLEVYRVRASDRSLGTQDLPDA